MKEFKYVVTDNEGIHARPAGELVKLVKGFESKITIEKDGKTVECRKLLALMGGYLHIRWCRRGCSIRGSKQIHAGEPVISE